MITFGTAKEIITPNIKTSLMGMGDVFGIPFTKINDDIYVRTLVLKDKDENTVVLCTFDLLFHDNSLTDRLREYVGQKYGVPYKNLHVNYSHTHYAPAVKGYDITYHKEEYENFVFERTCASVDRAFLNTCKGTVKFAKVEGDWNISRRKMVDGKCLFAPNPDGERDPYIYMLKFEDEEGKLRGILMNFACHPSNILHNLGTIISSEYPGRLCQKIEAEFYGCGALFVQGFGADSKLKKGVKNGEFLQITFKECDEVASSMASSVKETIMNESVWEKLNVNLGCTVFKLELPLEPYPLRYYQNEQKINTENGCELLKTDADYVIENYDKLPEVLTLDCAVIKINEKFYIYIMPGEPGINIQTVLREDNPDIKLLCFGYNDSIAYVPSDKMIKEGGYEAEESILEYRLKGKIKPGVDKIYKDSLKDAIKNLDK